MSENSLAEWLSSRDIDELVTLLQARPDLASPAPATTSVVATRAGNRQSVNRACDNLDTFTLTVLEALLVAGADESATSLDRLHALLGHDVPLAYVRDAVDRLRQRALAWGEYDSLCVVPSARGLFPTPGGLGRSSKTLSNTDVDAVLAELTAEERSVVDHLAKSSPYGQTRDAGKTFTLAQAQTPIQRLLARGVTA